MKKIIPVILIVVIAGGVFLFINQSTSVSPTTNNQGATTESGNKTGTDVVASTDGTGSVNVGTTTGGGSTATKDPAKVDEDGEEQDKPAAEAYKSAEEAMKAIKNGAVDYDDRILEQFTFVGEDCTWCDAVYSQVKSMLLFPRDPPRPEKLLRRAPCSKRQGFKRSLANRCNKECAIERDCKRTWRGT